MGNKKIDIDLVRAFIESAKADLKSASVELNANIFNNSVYHSQQACEKIIKALLIVHNRFVESHFVADLLLEIEKGSKIKKIVENARSLEKNWIIARYPFRRKKEVWNPTKEYTKIDAIDALKKSKFVFREIIKILKKKYKIF